MDNAFTALDSRLTTGEYGLASLVALRAAQSHKWVYTRSRSWARKGELENILEFGTVRYCDRSGITNITAVLEIADAVVKVAADGRSVSVAAYAVTDAVALDVVNKFKELYPVDIVVTEDQAIPVSFWFQTTRGPNNWSRRITVPGWDDIRANYVPVETELDTVMKWDAVPTGATGKLLLWYGPPGTGKTYAIRALGWEWRKWCELQYVTDPERFFGDASYMMDVLIEGEEGHSKSRLLICEDVGELMMADAKERSGQALSRLLNLTEGLIGQGMRVMVLFTTNEEIKSLHPAIRRPGRSLMNLGFKSFNRAAAAAWLGEHGDTGTVDKELTLADMYARVGHTEVIQTVAPVRRMGLGGAQPTSRGLELELAGTHID